MLQLKNRDLALFLEHVDQGFLTVDRDGNLAPERSRVLVDWFGRAAYDAKLWDYVAVHEPRIRQWLAISWEGLFDGNLPIEVIVDQLPKEIRADARIFGVGYQPILDESGAVDKVIVVLSDISAQIARRRAEEAQKELASVCVRIIADPRSVEVFQEEGSAIIEALQGGDGSLVEQQRWLHTLKGNASFIGLGRLSALCDEMEAHIAEMGTGPTPTSLERLEVLWDDFGSIVEPLLSRTRRSEVAIPRKVLVEHIEAIRSGVRRQSLAAEASLWLLEPTSARLGRAAEQAHAVARRLGKPDLDVSVHDNGVHLDPQQWASFWAAFVHVVRNAVDHGIEDADTRLALGKPAGGRLVLRTVRTPNEDIIEVEDDGAGIDWSVLHCRASALGVVVCERDPSALLFAAGVSTKTEVTEISGRGVGLGAVRAACEAMGGRVEVTSATGIGTTFSFRVPRGNAFQASLCPSAA